MNWTKLGPKEPDFNERVLFMNNDGDWWAGQLSKVETTAEGKVYTTDGFDEDGTKYTSTDATHFMRITTPKE